MIRSNGRKVVDSEIADGVSVIVTPKAYTANPKNHNAQEGRKLRVAAYCRVSKDVEQQDGSFETQKETYERMISEHPDWELAAIYADKGKSGTSRMKRAEFNRMLEDAEAGRVDKILVKSISRFSRNTVDMLASVRHLKEIGVSVFFEKEKIDTDGLASELLLTVFAAFAQEESFSISENMRSGMRNRFKMGIPKLSRIYGFDNTERGEIAVNKEQAKVVRRIFNLYANGMSTPAIAQLLNSEGLTTALGDSVSSEDGTQWHANTINGILHNEKYIGDCFMQKTVTSSYLTHTHTADLNVNSYYTKNHHEAIVDRDIYDTVQRSLYMKDMRNGVSQYPYYGFLRCPDCGRPMVRIMLKGRANRNAWVCAGDGTVAGDSTNCEPGKVVRWVDRNPCNDFMVRSVYIDDAVRKAIAGLEPEDHYRKTDKAIKEVQEEEAKRSTVELYDLDRLVERIDFPNWDSIRITWKDKSIDPSVVALRCDRAIDYPNPVIEETAPNEFRVGPIEISACSVATVERSVEANRALLRTATIEEPGENDPIQIPVVKIAAKVPKTDDCTKTSDETHDKANAHDKANETENIEKGGTDFTYGNNSEGAKNSEEARELEEPAKKAKIRPIKRSNPIMVNAAEMAEQANNTEKNAE